VFHASGFLVILDPFSTKITKGYWKGEIKDRGLLLKGLQDVFRELDTVYTGRIAMLLLAGHFARKASGTKVIVNEQSSFCHI
jgi:hypothetical protein